MIATSAVFRRMQAVATMSRVDIISADLAQILLDLDALNEEEIGTTADDKITFAEGWRDDVKDSIAAYGVTMTSAKPADYDSKIALIGAAVTAPLKTALDAANEEASADLTAGIALVDRNYADIKAAITAVGVDMTGVKPSGYDTKIADIDNQSRFAMNDSTGVIRIYGYNRWGKLDVVIPEKIRGITVTGLENNVFVPVSGEPPITSLTMPNTITTIGSACAAYNYISNLVLSTALTIIAEQAFRNNGAMIDVIIPPSVVTIQIYAFLSNPIAKITVGADVSIDNSDTSNPTMGLYGNAFVTLYNGNGRLAGVYEYATGTWTKTA